jgi:hypothetical protein
MSVLKILASYQVVKRGTYADKSRTLVIRSDGLYFLSSAEPAEIKRCIPIAAISSLSLYEKNKLLHIAVRSVEHDCIISKQGGVYAAPVDDIATIILRVAKNEHIPLDFSNEGPTALPSSLHSRLLKKENYKTIGQRLLLRSGKPDKPNPQGPVTLKVWDLVAGPLPFPVDTNKMTPQFQRNFSGMHIVMLGVVDHFDGPTAVRRALLFTLARLYLCEEQSGVELASCSLFAITRMAVSTSLKRITLEFTGEIFQALTFALVPAGTANAAAAAKESHVSEDVSQVGDVIRYLISRMGFSIAGDKPRSAPVDLTLSGKGYSSPLPVATRPGAEAVASASSPGSLANIPDYRAPFGELAQQFALPTTLLARPISRFTSKGQWEPRVLVITEMRLLMICDDRTNVKRSIPVAAITGAVVYSHLDGPVLALSIANEHDLVFRHRPDALAMYTLTQVLTVLRSLRDASHALECSKESVPKDQLKQTLLRRSLVKPASFVAPAQQVLQVVPSKTLPPAAQHAVAQPSSAAPAAAVSSSAPLAVRGRSSQVTTWLDATLPASDNSPETPLRLTQQQSYASLSNTSEQESRGLFGQQNSLPRLTSEGSTNLVESKSAAATERSRHPSPISSETAPMPTMHTVATASPESLQALPDSRRAAAAGHPVPTSVQPTVLPPVQTAAAESPESTRGLSGVFEAAIINRATDPFQDLSREDCVPETQRSTSREGPGPLERQIATGSPTAHSHSRFRPNFVAFVDPTNPSADTTAVQPPVNLSSAPAAMSPSSSSLRLSTAPEASDGAVASATAARQLAEEAAEALRAAAEAEQRRRTDAERRSREDDEWERRFGVKRSGDYSSPRPAAPVDDGFFRPSRNQIPFPTAQSLKVAARGDDGIRNYFFRAKLGENDTFTFVGMEPLLQALDERFGRKGRDPLDVPSEERVVVVVAEEGRVMVGARAMLLDLLRMASLRSWVRRDVVMCRSSSFAWTEMAVVPFVLGVERGSTPCQLATARIEAALQ